MPKIVKQLSVFLENKPGVLASVSSALAAADVNLLAISVADTVDHALVRLVVSEPTKARDIFEQAGVLCIENDVLAIDLAHQPGELAGLAQDLAKKKLNIDYLYGSADSAAPGAMIYVRVSNPREALTTVTRKRKKKAGKSKKKTAKATKKSAARTARKTAGKKTKKAAAKKTTKKTAKKATKKKAKKKVAKKR